MEKLIKIQSELKAPKNLNNQSCDFKYRTLESILESLKPLLKVHGCTLTITDSIETHGDRVYVKATATISDGPSCEIVSAYAREQESESGMSSPQITGACSSYARKSALGGLFLIDDSKDPDSVEKITPTVAKNTPVEKVNTTEMINATKLMNESKNMTELTKVWNDNKKLHKNANFVTSFSNNKKRFFDEAV